MTSLCYRHRVKIAGSDFLKDDSNCCNVENTSPVKTGAARPVVVNQPERFGSFGSLPGANSAIRSLGSAARVRFAEEQRP